MNKHSPFKNVSPTYRLTDDLFIIDTGHDSSSEHPTSLTITPLHVTDPQTANLMQDNTTPNTTHEPLVADAPPVADTVPAVTEPEIPNTITTPDIVPTVTTPCRSTRPTRQPSCLQHYSCNNVLYPIRNYLSYDQLPKSFKSYICQVSNVVEPEFHHQAVKSS